MLAFLAEVDSTGLELHSFMLASHGKVVAEGWWKAYRADLTMPCRVIRI
ncbi:MAG: hypothetical protein M3O26_05680 [Pseudomonadota bacterium]|nr:hypothetical protein [Pseudomonadota bacterium]